MTPISFSETLESKRGKYLLQTSTNGFSSKVVSSIFKDGQLINDNYVSYTPKLSADELFKIAEQLHARQKHEITSIFQLIEKYAETKNEKQFELIAQGLLRRNLIDEAAACLEQFCLRNVTAAGCYFLLGLALYRQKNYPAAITALKHAVAIRPQYADYHHWLGIAYFSANACGLAASEFQAATAINVYFAEAFYYLGLTYLKNAIVRDDYNLKINLETNALQIFETATKLNPAYKREAYLLGIEAFKQQDYTAALAQLIESQNAIEKPDPREIVDNFYLRLLDSDVEIEIVAVWDYIKELNTIIRKFPGYADLYQDLGIAYTILGTAFQKEAGLFFEKALKRNPNYQNARKSSKLVMNENRGLQFLVDSMLEFSRDSELNPHRGLKLQFF
ncbi:tetratricopeptide repeat protein [candidate division KSB1 bacterium]|nr:tetratricopeptide repeat protein [candidate division KSB1 bacterium]